MLFLMSRRGQNIRIRLKDFTPNKQLAKEIIFGGTPSLSRQGLGSVSTILLNVAAGAYGDAAIAGMSIVTRISFSLMLSLSDWDRVFSRSAVSAMAPICTSE